MRIISGTLKGRRLSSWKNVAGLRPMTDRVKETVFNVLTAYFFENCRFLDLFSGTGHISLEALSRGAREAHAVEKLPSCIKIIKKNSQILADPKKLILHREDVFSFLKKAQKSSPLKSPKIKPFDIIVADPPFSLFKGENLMENLRHSFLTQKGTAAVIETSHKENLKNSYPPFYLFAKKVFSDKRIWFYEFK